MNQQNIRHHANGDPATMQIHIRKHDESAVATSALRSLPAEGNPASEQIYPQAEELLEK